MTAEQRAVGEQRRTRILSVLLLLILLGSTAGYAFLYYGESGATSSDAGIKEGSVQETSAGWSFTADGKTLTLQKSPAEVADSLISVAKNPADYAGTTLYIDASNQAIFAELASTIGSYALRIQPACYGSCERNVPEVSCNETLIVWKDVADNRVYSQDNCVFIEGDMSTVDAFIYNVFGL